MLVNNVSDSKLITSEELNAINESKVVPPTPSTVEHYEKEPEASDPHKYQTFMSKPLFEDILGDGYEFQLDLDNILS